MSWPGGDETSPGDSGQHGDQLGRPTDVGSIATFRGGKVMGFTPEQADRALKLLSVPYESLPQLPFFAPLFRYSPRWHKQQVASILIDTSVALGRVPTPTEADAQAYYRAKFLSRAAWAPLAVYGTAGYMVYRGRSTFRFPFYTPKPASFNPSFFPLLSSPFIKGQAAVWAWHALRFGAYAFVNHYVVGALVMSFAQTSYVVSILRDERLKQVREAMMKPRDRGRQQPERGAPAPPPPPPIADTTSPAEPTASYQAYGQTTQPPQPPQRPPQWTQRAPEPQDTLDDDDPSLFDDASPVAPSQRQQPQRRPAGSPPSPGEGSAWDRVRQRAKAEEGTTWEPKQKTEPYTFASADQEKAYAKAQAQKEFDAMLERERRGMGDSGGRN
jgi:hypothetical protein